MNQSDLGLNLTTKRTRKREFLAQMERVVPWAALVQIVAPHSPEGKKGRPPFPIETMLRVHFMQQWFTLSDPAMEEALHDMPLFREFVGLTWDSRIPDESTILRFRHLLEKHKLTEQILATVNAVLLDKGLMLKAGTVVDATLIAAPSSTKNQSGERDPEMKQSKKGNQWHFGMKAHIGVDAESGLVHTVRGTSGNVNDVVEANGLLHGEEKVVFADSGYRGAHKRPDAKQGVTWYVAMRPSSRKPHEKTGKIGALVDQIEHLKASVRAKVEHPFRVIKRQFGHVKVRYPCRHLPAVDHQRDLLPFRRRDPDLPPLPGRILLRPPQRHVDEQVRFRHPAADHIELAHVRLLSSEPQVPMRSAAVNPRV